MVGKKAGDSRIQGISVRGELGSCTNHAECEKACPKSISINFIPMVNADYLKAMFKNRGPGVSELTNPLKSGVV